MRRDNWLGVEPPKDANWDVIPLDTEVLYTADGQTFHVNNIKYVTKKKRWETYGYFEGGFGFWEGCTDKLLLAPPDSWNKLEEDAKKSACRYFYGPEEKDIVSCMDCKHSYQATGRPCRVSMNIELMKRAKQLAGIEEEAQR